MSDKYAGHYNLTRKRWEPEIEGMGRMTLHEWGQVSGVKMETIWWRRFKLNWSWEDAIFKSTRRYKDNNQKPSVDAEQTS